MEDVFLKARVFAVLREIREILEKTDSKNQLAKKQDYDHALDVYQWLMLLHPDKDFSFHIAALGHDIERSVEEKRINSEEFETHEEFKKAHAENSAKILKEIMIKHSLPKEIIDKTTKLVLEHEFKSDSESNIISNMDSLGNIIWCDRVKEETPEKDVNVTMKRMIEKMDLKYKQLLPYLKLKYKFFFDMENA